MNRLTSTTTTTTPALFLLLLLYFSSSYVKDLLQKRSFTPKKIITSLGTHTHSNASEEEGDPTRPVRGFEHGEKMFFETLSP